MHVRIRVHLRWLAVIAVVAIFAPAALAAEFSADMVGSGQGMAMAGTLYLKGQSARFEMTQGPVKSIIIWNAVKKKAWLVTPATKTYMAKSLSAKELAQQAEQMQGKLPGMPSSVKPTRAGTETVNGYQCDKMVFTWKGTKVTSWMAKRLTFPVRTEAVQPGGKVMRQELKNIKERKLPDSLFEVPSGYKQMSMPGPGSLPGAAGRGGPGAGSRK